jgi:DNA invertase Pin-like site-specific DNA recombinase
MSLRPLVVYYRVSTEQQKRSGLGLMAQHDAVRRYLEANPGRVVAELTEIESGRKDNRPAIKEALWLCRVYDARLIVARLDRLARSTAMIAGLMDSGVDFIAADMPLANRFTIHILAAVAEYEARLISERTKAAFAAAKVRGRTFGNPNPATHRFSAAARKAQVRAMRESAKARALNYLPLLCKLRDSGETLHGIALQLTMMEIETPGKRKVWRDRTVAKMFEYAGERKPRPRSSRRTQADRRAAQSDFQLAEYFAGQTNGPYFDRGANR